MPLLVEHLRRLDVLAAVLFARRPVAVVEPDSSGELLWRQPSSPRRLAWLLFLPSGAPSVRARRRPFCFFHAARSNRS